MLRKIPETSPKLGLCMLARTPKVSNADCVYAQENPTHKVQNRIVSMLVKTPKRCQSFGLCISRGRSRRRSTRDYVICCQIIPNKAQNWIVQSCKLELQTKSNLNCVLHDSHPRSQTRDCHLPRTVEESFINLVNIQTVCILVSPQEHVKTWSVKEP